MLKLHTSRESAQTPDACERPTQFDCSGAIAVMQLGPNAITDEALMLFIAHLDSCSSCGDAFDASHAPLPSSPLRNLSDLNRRLEDEVMARCTASTKALASGSERGISTDYVGQLAPGTRVKGQKHLYRIIGLLSAGDFTETYLAEAEASSSTETREAQRLVIKIPRLSGGMSPNAAAERLGLLNKLLRGLAHELSRLAGLSQVAQLLDVGDYLHRLSDRAGESTFLAYEFVRGTNLPEYARQQYGSGDRFCGVPSADVFADWARRLARGVLEIHNRLLVHGDICPKNVLIDSNGQPIFIDVGESVFREVISGGNEFSAFHYRAPEGPGAPSSDIYSLGGLLYFLATGRDPIGLGRTDSREAHKLRIAAEVKEANASLCKDDAAVIDVIAMCLRKEGRVQHAGAVLKDINIFWREPVPERLSDGLAQLSAVAASIEDSGNTLYRHVASDHIQSLRDLLEGLSRGFYDASGSPDIMRWAANALLNTLGTGDRYVTISLPAFWYPDNIGTNGRFLSMCRNAAKRGAIVQRVLMLDPTLADPHLQQIVNAQLAAVSDLEPAERERFAVRYVLTNPEQRRHMLSTGKQFGLLVKGDTQIGMWPVYDSRDNLVTLRFRSGPRQTEGLYAAFEDMWGKASPLVDLVLPNASFNHNALEAAL